MQAPGIPQLQRGDTRRSASERAGSNRVYRSGGRFREAVEHPLVWWLLFLGTFVIRATHAWSTVLHNDVGALLYLAGRWLDGATLYREIIDPNSAMIYMIYASAVSVGRVLGVSSILVLQVEMIMLALGSLLLCRYLVDMIFSDRTIVMRGVMMVILAYLAFPVGDLWQREHIMILLMLPYLMGAALRVRNIEITPRLATIIGLLAGVGTVIKPYYLPVWGLLELYLLKMCGRKSLMRRENIVIAAIVIPFWLGVLIFLPGYVEVLRRAMDIYHAYHRPYVELVRQPGAISCVAALVLALLLPLQGKEARIRGVFLVAAATYLAVALYAHTAWAYHFYPTLVTSRLSIFLSLWLFMEQRPKAKGLLRHWREAAAVTVAVSIMVLAGGRFADAAIHPDPPMELRGLLEKYSGRSVADVTCTIRPLFPAANYVGTHLVSRFAYLWMLPGCYSAAERGTLPGNPFPYHPIDRMGATERYMFDAYISDLVASRPDVILIDQREYKDGFGPTSFDFLDYFSRDTRFATLLDGYDKVGTVDHHLVLERRGTVSTGN
jgi:hypothetical protein